ncbi:hypothetical protein M4578_16725 [Salipiger sp. P9]|uniref:hypothetical protein n=1 Tax=Salipiger pentaromativorans TaxID=2943193 RepID=UPI00215788E0|nr:hypothetical protein [Salipiger pentaromativorans]MCR8549476.1 hypothetical protein [Salipiger pentaromativorans]
MPIVTVLARCLVLGLALLALALPGAAAPYGWGSGGAVRVIGNDSGGALKPRIEEVRRMRARGDRVEIRGSYCRSSCTLYLGAGDVCVSPATQFGFHGPGYPGRPIRYDRFDYWSQRMAAHYPPELSAWFLTRARFVTAGYMTLSGAELIRMGVPPC